MKRTAFLLVLLFLGGTLVAGTLPASAQDDWSAPLVKTPMLLAFDGFDDDSANNGDDMAMNHGPASDETDEDLMDGDGGSGASGHGDGLYDPDRDPGYGIGFDPDKE